MATALPKTLQARHPLLRRLRALPRVSHGSALARWQGHLPDSAARSASSIWRTRACGSATRSIRAEVLAEDRDDLRGFAARPGQVAGGDVAGRELQERRISSAKSPATSASRRSRRGSWSTVSVSRCITVRSTSSPAKWKWTRRSSAARRATCTSRSASGGSLERAAKDKTAVMGILERGGKVRTQVVANRKKKTLQAEVHKHVEAGSALYTDALLSYEGLAGRVRASGDRPCRRLRGRAGPHERAGELLVAC